MPERSMVFIEHTANARFHMQWLVVGFLRSIIT